jgi:spore maturation protein SpmB
MLQMFQKAFRPSRNDSLSHSFSRLGWLGFWMQVAVGAIPLALTIYALVFGRNSTPGTRAGFPLIEYLSISGLLVLAFTTMWSYRYTRLAVRLADPDRRPAESAVQRTVWTGIKAGTIGIVFSMLVMLFEIGQLLICFLRAP